MCWLNKKPWALRVRNSGATLSATSANMEEMKVVRCCACDAVHLAVEATDLVGEPLDVYRCCRQCGSREGFRPGELRVDELLRQLPACLLASEEGEEGAAARRVH